MIGKLKLALLLLLATPFASIAGEQSPGHYFLVIDHSGSMLQKIKSGPDAGRTRWDVMRSRAADFIERLPDGATAWVGVFSARDPNIATDPNDPLDGWMSTYSAILNDPAGRRDFSYKIRSLPEPGLSNGTWLHQATLEALQKVAIAGQRDPDAYLTVMIYTDGVDQGHGRTTVEMNRNPGSACSREEVDQRIRQLRTAHRNFNVVEVYRPGEESILDAHVVRLIRNRIQLASPLVAPHQVIDLELMFRDDEQIKLEGRRLSIGFEQQDVSAAVLPLEIEGGPFVMKNGSTRLKLRAVGQWPPGRDIRARIKLAYPSLDDAFLVEEGGNVIDVFFQVADTPVIRDLLPLDDAAFPVDREIGFSLTTLAGSEAEWDFGDGTQARGNPVRHAFAEPGRKRVSVKVTDPRTGLSTSTTLSLNIFELKLALDPFPVDIRSGREVTLIASSSGDFRDFEWDVGGRTFVGKTRSDGGQGTTLTLAFDRPGPVQIKVRGNGKVGGYVESEAATLTVREVPTIRVSAPAPGESLYFGSTRELRAEVEGINADSLSFTVIAEGREILPPRKVDVRREGTLRIAVLPWIVPVLPVKSQASLTVETVGIDPVLRREIPLLLESEPASIEIVLPEGREPFIHRETQLMLVVNATVTNIRWNFGSGWREGNVYERHTWTAYDENVTIKAEAKGPDGTLLEAPPVEIKVPVRPATAAAAVIYKGKLVGADIAKVPVNSTLKLRAETSGDVISSRWLLDGVTLAEGQETITVKERGIKTLQLIVDGTPEAGGPSAATATVEFRTSDKILFWVLAAGCLAVLGLAGRLLLGNKWRFAELHVGRKTEGSYSDGGSIKMPWGIKSWWTKRSEIAMAALDKKTCTTWNGDTRLRFESGKDPKLVALGRQWNNNRLNPESSKNLKPSYMKRWTFTRIPLTTIRQNHEHAKGSINLMIPQLKPGLVGRWPEFLFMGFLLGSVAAVRLLFEWLY